MAEDKKVSVLVKNHVRDPETGETYLRGSHEVDEVTAYRLTSSHPENVSDANEVASLKKSELVEVAEDLGIQVEDSDTKDDLAKKLGKK